MRDSGRLLTGLVSLNVRKSLFRLAPRKFPCPCQNPSDSGKAWQTSCDAVSPWSSGERFRQLCPLLKRNPAGQWVCSVDTPAVRPFWGRALLVYFVGAVGLYATAALAAFLFLHSFVGYPVRYESVAWPPAWHEIRQARARFFFEKAERAFRANQTVEGIMWLSQSYELDPGNYAAGRVLAQLWQNTEAEVSDRVYRQLLRDHPEQRPATAQAWFLALLARGDFRTLGALAWEELHDQPAQSSVWANALLLCSRRTGDTHYLEQAVATPAGLPPYATVLCRWELQIRGARPDVVRMVLTQSIPTKSRPYVFYYRVDRLLHAGMAPEALQELSRCRELLDPSDRLSLYLDAYAAAGWQNILDGQVDKLLATQAGSVVLVDVLSAHLIRYPNPAILAKLFTSVAQHPLVGTDGEKLTAFACLFCAAGTNGDWTRQEAIAAAIKTFTGARYRTLDMVGTYFRRPGSGPPVEHYLPALPPLPVDVTLALYEFSDRQRALAAIPRVHAAR
jgi:hypothetical protein